MSSSKNAVPSAQAGPSSVPGSAAASEAGDPPHTPNSNYDNSNYDNPNDDRKLSRGTGKRNRVHFACTECYRRKQKCNRETPCQHCIARKVPERCRTFQPGEDANDVGSRLSRVEKMLEDYLPALMHRVEVAISATKNTGGAGPGVPRLSQPQPRSGRGGAGVLTASPEAMHRGSAKDERAAEYASQGGLESDEDPAADQDSLSPKTGTFIGGGAMEMHVGTLLGKLPGNKPTPAFREPVRTVEGEPELDDIMAEYGSTLGGAADMLAALPDRTLCNKLLDHFYEQINWIRQPMPRRSFIKSFNDFWDTGPKLTASNINTFAILCTICAISCLSMEDPNLPTWARCRILAARRYHFAARKALHLSTVMGRENLDHIVGMMLSCRFMLLDRRIAEAYSANGTLVRAAYTIGLHRDGTKLGLNPVDSEARRRVWASLYFLDRLLSVTTGRPPAIDDRIVDVRPPSSEVDEDIYPMPKNPPKMPAGVEPPTPMLYAIYRHRIALIEGRILAGLQSLDRAMHVSDVLALDKEIRALQDGLPFYLRAKRNKGGIECDKSLDSVYGFLTVQRFLVHTEINTVRIALHRPFLLRSSSNPKYMPCRDACLDAALHDIELRNDTLVVLRETASYELTQALRVHIGTFKWFHSLLVCGVVLLMQPDAPNADQLREHLQQFVKDHHGRIVNQADEMRTREAHVIELFLAKIDELQQQKKSDSGAGKVAGRKRSKKHVSIDESSKKPRANSPASRAKGGRPEEARAEPHEAERDEHATADLLLGFGQQARHSNQGDVGESKRGGDRSNGASSSSRTLDDAVRSGPRSAQPPAEPSPYSKGSGDWPRGYPGVSNNGNGNGNGSQSGGGSGTNSPLGTPKPDLLAGGTGSAIPSPITATSATGSAGNSDEAQTIFDSWYRAEFATASMPSYEAPYPENGYAALPFGLGMQGMSAPTSTAMGGPTYGWQGQQGGAVGSGLQQAQGGGLAGSTAWDLGGMGGGNMGVRGGTPAFATLNQGLRPGAGGSNNTIATPASSSSGAQQPAYPAQQGVTTMAQGSFGGGGSVPSTMGGSLAPQAYGAGGGGATGWPNAATPQPMATAAAGTATQGMDSANPGFDPAFWQTLIDKIAS